MTFEHDAPRHYSHQKKNSSASVVFLCLFTSKFAGSATSAFKLFNTHNFNLESGEHQTDL